MVEIVDHLVGRVLANLDETDLAKNTLVVFTSDNGGHPEIAGNGPLRGSKCKGFEWGLRVQGIGRWRGRVRAGAVSDVPFLATAIIQTTADANGTALPRDVRLDELNTLP